MKLTFSIEIGEFDSDLEIAITIDNDRSYYINPEQVFALQKHLAKQITRLDSNIRGEWMLIPDES